MKKILVAGAGHGGLTAAIRLAENGYDVTVFEKHPRKNIGHDWHDCIYSKVFEQCEIPALPESEMMGFLRMTYYSPSKNIELKTEKEPHATIKYVDRRVLLGHLIGLAEKAGVKFQFETEILAPITEKNTVTGIKIKNKNGEQNVFGDLIIDACGIHSPVRKNLPGKFGIQKNFARTKTFTIYRAYFENTGIPCEKPEYAVYFCNEGRTGLDWVIQDENFIDVLVGSFDSLTQNQISKTICNFRKTYPSMGEKMIRGGYIADIPMRTALPKFTLNGYAAVGDSVSMTEPLSGSGITKSMTAGHLLAETVINAKEQPLTEKVLYPYQRDFLKEYMRGSLKESAIKGMMTDLGVEGLDIMFRKNVLGEKEMFGGKYDIKDLMEKVRGIGSSPAVLPALLKAGIKIAKIDKIKKELPEKYDSSKIAKWVEMYEKF